MEFTVVSKGLTHRVLVDDVDWPWVSQFKWHITKAGYVQRNGKMVNWVKEPASYLHREVMECTKGDGQDVDHINRNPLDNRRENLRVTTHGSNMQNIGGHRDAKHSAHRGVSFNSRCGCWVANHMLNGKRWSKHCLTEADAVAAVEAHRAAVLGG